MIEGSLPYDEAYPQVNRMPRFHRTLLPVLLIAAVLAALTARATEKQLREFRDCSDCPEMVAIPGGAFEMGSPPSEPGRFDSEGPLHPVSVHSFALGKYDVTNEEFLTFLKATGYEPAPCNPILGLTWRSPGHGEAYSPGVADAALGPAVCLNWYDAEAYVAWLNARLRGVVSVSSVGGAGSYRLPSEAEWEYAARGGTTTARWWGEAIGTDNANCNGCGSRWDGTEIAPVGSFTPNPFGLYDMLGNVWQWTDDCWNESYVGAPRDSRAWKAGDCTKRVLRGGSWSNLPAFLRSAARSRADAAGRDFDYSNYAGFRVARTLP